MKWNLDKLGTGVVAALSILVCLCPATADNLAAARLQRIAAARATLAKNKELAWQGVITADRNELADLHKASIAAMRAENAQSVVTIQGFIAAVRRRLDDEKAGRPFPPGFHVPETYAGTDPVMARAEKRRDVLVTAAEAQLAKAEVAFRHAVLSADRHEIMEIKNRVQAAMKSLDANAVVMDMHRLKLANAQLRSDLSSRSERSQAHHTSGIFGPDLAGKRIIFVLDRSGAAVGKLYLLRSIVERAMNSLSPRQEFAVIVFASKYRILVANRLLGATAANKARVAAELNTVIAEGRSAGMLEPFLRPLQAAWAMRASTVLLLTSVRFDPRLVRRIDLLNKGRHVSVDTFASGDPTLDILLRKISRETGGTFLDISAAVLERTGRVPRPGSSGATSPP